MNKRHMHVAVTAGLTLALTVGSVPAPAFAEALQDAGVLQATDRQEPAATEGAAPEAAAEVAPQAEETEPQADQAAQTETTAEDQVTINNPGTLRVEAGKNAELPTTVTTHHADGTTEPVAVTWTGTGAAAGTELSKLPAGTYTYEAAVEGAAEKATLQVEVVAMPEQQKVAAQETAAATPAPAADVTIESIDPVTAELYAGSDSLGYLPYQLTAKMSDGSTQMVYPSWDKIPADKMDGVDDPEKFTVEGTVAGYDGKVVCTVYVYQVRKVEQPVVATAPGKAPILPDHVYVTYQDDVTDWRTVTWDKIDASQYATHNIFNVSGTVEGTTIKSSAQVRVANFKDYTKEIELTTEKGRAPYYPSTVNVSLDDGSSANAAVTWDEVDSSKYQQAGTFDVRGVVESFGVEVTAHVTVADVKITNTHVNIKRIVGDQKSLESYLLFETGDNHQTQYFSIDWGKYSDASLYQEAGTKEVTGVVAGTDTQVTATVTVVEIANIESPSVATLQGVVPRLAPSAYVTYSDGTSDYEDVNWGAITPDMVEKPGVLEITGSLYDVPSIKVKATITVQESQTPANVEVSTLVGMKPDLPYSVSVTLWNGEKTTAEVQWETPDPAGYAKEGTFKVQGYLRGSNVKVTALVSAYPAQSTQVADYTLGIGGKLDLSTYAEITLTNGDVKRISGGILWDKVSEDKLSKPGSFDVAGKVLGTSVALQAHVTVGEIVAIAGYPNGEASSTVPKGALLKNVLSTYGTGYFADGSAASTTITWNIKDTDTATKDMTVTGTVQGSNVKLTEHIKVVDGFTAVPEEVTIVKGAPITDNTLPRVVSVKCGEEMVLSADVTWNADNIDWTKSQTITGTAKVHYFGGDTVLAEVPATLNLKVIDSVKDFEPVEVWTLPGEAPSLPSSIDKLNAEGWVDTTAPVTWDAINPAQYAVDQDGKTFTVRGVVTGTSIPVEATVEVASVAQVFAPSAVSTPSGQRPSLPSEVTIKTSTGELKTASVSWGEILGSFYTGEPGDEHEIQGTVYVGNNRSELKTSIKIIIAGVVKPMQAQTKIAATVGVMPKLPGQVAVELSDGTVGWAEVEWDKVPVERIKQEGEFTVNGKVTGVETASGASLFFRATDNGVVTAKVKMLSADAKPVANSTEFVMTVPAGVETELSEEDVPLSLSDGNLAHVHVTWDTSAVDWNTAGTYVVKGTAKGHEDADITCYVNVRSASRTIASLEPLSIVVAKGSKRAEVEQQLTRRVTAKYTDGTKGLVKVTWDLTPLTDDALAKTGSFDLTGIVEGFDGTAKATITVEDADAKIPAKVQDVKDVETYEGTAPVLPSTVTVLMKDGKTTKESAVTWEDVPAGSWAAGKGGTSFTVKGQTEDGLTASVRVVVKTRPEATGVTVSGEGVADGKATLEAGKTLQLSAAVEPGDALQGVTWSSSDEAVATVDASGKVTAVAEGKATITVMAASGVKAEVVVTVAAAEVTPEPEPEPEPTPTPTPNPDGNQGGEQQPGDQTPGDQGGNGAQNGNGSNSSNKGKASAKKDAELPSTGDPSLMATAATGLAGMSALGAGLVELIRRKRQK